MQLSKDLSERFPDDRGYSGHNLRNMKKFASEYPAFPIWQVPLAKLEQLPIRKASLAELPCDGNGWDCLPSFRQFFFIKKNKAFLLKISLKAFSVSD